MSEKLYGILLQEAIPSPDKPQKIKNLVVNKEAKELLEKQSKEIERLNNIINNFEKLLSEEQAKYEQYYQKGGTYVLPIEVFNELWGEMENWKDTCKQKESIIKEVRKYANSLTIFENIKEDLLDILQGSDKSE